MIVSIGESRRSVAWRAQDMTWDQLRERLKTTVRTGETLAEFMAMGPAEQTQVKDRGGYLPGRLNGGRRRKGTVETRSALTLDLDRCPQGVDAIVRGALACRWAAHTTHKHTPEHPRLRVVIPLKREVSAAEYPAVARMVASRMGMDLMDDSTYEPERLMFWPTTAADGEFQYWEGDGPLLDPDQVLAQYKDWQDEAHWPRSTREAARPAARRHGRRAADPLGKTGVVGAFCRAYTIQDAIERFLPDVYEATPDAGRFHYRPARSEAGLVVYDGRFAYSHHAKDPACGMELNSFDLVRVHLFRHLDAQAADGTPPASLPSFKAMADMALKDPGVKRQMARDRLQAAQTEFTADGAGAADGGQADGPEGWEATLECDRHGRVRDTLGNLEAILRHDPALKGIGFNLLSDQIEATGPLPWKRAAPFWRDVDDSQLVSYIDKRYGTFSQRNYTDALNTVADERAFHPILQHLHALPEWDGVERVDTLLVDYLGAADSPYVRAVTRKTLVAAIRRVKQPGCKFDTMLVLDGPQGIGKSTLIARLAGPWFSDSLILSDTRDKTAAEKLQGYWILEIGELTGLRRTEVETLRSFLSRQDDIYRPSYGRRAVKHPRQCVFLGTTNAETGYLRDTTGNRRFWPVKTPGGGTLRSWDLDQPTVDQIWAEALTYEEAGEPLYLDAALTPEAERRQAEALESDEREGIVAKYLDMPLPDTWAGMDPRERHAWFLDEGEFGHRRPADGKPRSRVCTVEVWCECFGKDRGDLNNMEGNKIRGILLKLGWRRAPRKAKMPPYDTQWVYERPDEDRQ